MDILTTCPLCNEALAPAGPNLSIEQLLTRPSWDRVLFPKEIVDTMRGQSETTRLYICDRCGFEIFHPPVIGDEDFYRCLQDQMPDYYPEWRWDFGAALDDIRNADSVLEVGCGRGIFLQAVVAARKSACGLEYSEAAAARARDAGLEIETRPERLSDRRFDAVLAFHVLEHVRDPVEFGENLVRWTRFGGHIIISVPDMDGPVRFHPELTSNAPPHHATRWRETSLRRWALRLGLDVVAIRHEPFDLAAENWYHPGFDRHLFPRSQGARKTVHRIMDLFFAACRRFGIRRIPFLRGQSLYGVFRKS